MGKLTAETRRKPPRSLSAEAKGWWVELTETFAVDNAGAYLLLQTALESFDDMRRAQIHLAKEGVVLKDSRGGWKQNPSTMVVRDARNLMLRCLKQLNLDLAPGDDA